MKKLLTLALVLAALAAFSGLGIAQQKADPLRGELVAQAKKPRPPSSTDSSRRTASCTTPLRTIVGWWPFDELMGSDTAADIAAFSSYGPYGVVQNQSTYASAPNSPTPVVGKVGYALSFDGNDSLTVPDDYEVRLSNRDKSMGPPYKFCSGFTIDAWVKTTQSTGLAVILDKRVNPAAPVGYHLFLYKGKLGFELADGKPPGSACGPESTNPCTNYVASSPNVADGSWHLIAVTVQVHGSVSQCEEKGQLYVDVSGVMTPVLTFVPRTHNVVTGPVPDIANTADLYIGRRMPAFGGPAYFKGRIDELEFYNHANDTHGSFSDGALTQTQLQAIYNAGSAGKCK